MNNSGGEPDEHPGRKILEAREARGWSRPKLKRESGVPVRTIQRVESGQGNPERRTVAALRRALGLPHEGAPADPVSVLRSSPSADLAVAVQALNAELAQRLITAEQLAGGDRFRDEHVPPGLAGKPGVERGPALDQSGRSGDNASNGVNGT